MEKFLSDKKILVMGVANKRSIAWAISKTLIDNGAQVCFSYYGDRSKRSLEKLLKVEGLKGIKLFSCNVQSDESIESLFKSIKETFGNIDGVVHSIAHGKKEELRGNYYETSREGYQMAHDISAFSLVRVTKYAQGLMSQGGSIITLSYLGGERVVKNYNVMGVAKASLEASVKYLAHDLGKREIRVNAISAGPIKTLAARGVGDFNLIKDNFTSKAPIPRMVTSEEVANTAFFLLSNLSSGITGEIIHVDCGFNILGY